MVGVPLSGIRCSRMGHEVLRAEGGLLPLGLGYWGGHGLGSEEPTCRAAKVLAPLTWTSVSSIATRVSLV